MQAMVHTSHRIIFKIQVQTMETRTSSHPIKVKALSIEKLNIVEVKQSQEAKESNTRTETPTTIKTNIQPLSNNLNKMGQTTRISRLHNLQEMKWDIIKATAELIVIMNWRIPSTDNNTPNLSRQSADPMEEEMVATLRSNETQVRKDKSKRQAETSPKYHRLEVLNKMDNIQMEWTKEIDIIINIRFQ